MNRVIDSVKKTPLHAVHLKLGARMVPFAGWEMPVHYTGLMEEHGTVRTRCGIFDVSHMGEIEVRGPRALEAVQQLTTNDASRLIDGQVQYTLICNDKGGVIDDVTLYRFSDERFVFCVNASNTEKAFHWMKEKTGSLADVTDMSDRVGQIAVQGPLSEDLLQPIVDRELAPLRFYRFLEGAVGGVRTVISRTGYTGEDGFEIYCKTEETEAVWQAIMESGRDWGICPVGLGPRDTLRLEMGYPLYGNELDEETTPLEAGLDRFVRLDKLDFIGKESLVRQRREGTEKKLVGLELHERGVPRQGYPIIKEGALIGEITSGTFSPSLERAIALGYVRTPFALPHLDAEVEIRKRRVKVRVVEPPFYRREADSAGVGQMRENNRDNKVKNTRMAG
ncbi:MAG: glycine cleavage system aminomethyltransferase GcvT [Thermodesulfobacteriota bacterium]